MSRFDEKFSDPGELDTVMNFTAKASISRIMEGNPKAVKEALISNCASILACYRKNCASPSSAGQLILPECMKLLPLYTNCLLKSDVLSGGADVGCDERAFLMNAVSAMDILSTVVYFYPRLLPLHEMHTSDVTPNPIRYIELPLLDTYHAAEEKLHSKTTT